MPSQLLSNRRLGGIGFCRAIRLLILRISLLRIRRLLIGLRLHSCVHLGIGVVLGLTIVVALLALQSPA